MNLRTFTAFRSRNYRLYFSGQAVSLMGTWMQRTAVYWIIYARTHSAFMVGVAVFSIQFPSFLFSLFGGAVADRYNRYKVLLATQIASMIQAIVLTAVVLFIRYNVAEILGISIILGIINAFDVPARQSLMQHMVDHTEDLGNAIALNSSMANLARLIGPALGGIVLDKLGAGTCFGLNALSFVAVILSLLMMHLPASLPPTRSKKMMTGLAEGLTYLRSNPSLGLVILLLALCSLLVLPYDTLLPVVAKMTLHGNASTYGFLNSFTGIGAIGGAIFLASLGPRTNLKRVLLLATTVFGIGLILFSQTRTLLPAFLFIILAGFGRMSQITISNTLLQTTSSIEMRGRVISYFAMAVYGMNPVGALLIGSISLRVGTAFTLLLQGIAALLLVIVFSQFLWNNRILPAKMSVL